MLEYAKKHEPKLKELYWDIAFDPFYQFIDYSAFREDIKLPEDTYRQNDFVSVWNGEIIGHITYSINRIANSVDSFGCVHFGKNYPYIFGKDLVTALKEIFEKFKFNKISFCVVIGNPIEKTYDKLVQKYGGRIVGIWKQDRRLLDGNLYDSKCYEILAEDYFNTIKNNEKK